MGRLNDLFIYPSESHGLQTSAKKIELRGEIEFKDVWFRYGGESTEWVLKGVSFKIESGQNVAIIGPSGSGKSTIAYLLTRLYEPTKGQILIDGRDYREYETSWLRAQVGLLTQEPSLFSGTIAENIAYAASHIDFERVTAAAKLSVAEKFITSKPTWVLPLRDVRRNRAFGRRKAAGGLSPAHVREAKGSGVGRGDFGPRWNFRKGAPRQYL